VEPVAIAAAAVALFLLSNKVYSPTYDVWLVVFFVLLPVSTRHWIAFCAVDLLIAVTVYGYFHGLGSVGFVHDVLPWLVIARTIVLVALIVVALSPRARAPDGQKSSGAGSGGGLASSPGIGCSHQSVSSTRRAIRQPASVRTNRS
jgi:hypothetical protein